MGELAEALESYRQWLDEDEQRAQVTITVPCELIAGVEVEAEIGRHVVRVDEPKGVGGKGTAPNPVGYALAALGSCAAIGYGYWSDLLGIPFDSLRVSVEGDLDPRGTFAFEDGVNPSFSAVRLTVEISGSEPKERYEGLVRKGDAYSPVLAVFTSEIPVATTLQIQ